MKKYTAIGIAAFLTLFGLLTVFMGGSVIFDLFGIRAIEGNYVLFVVWANWICGFLYLIAAYGLVKQKRWTSKLLFAAFLLLAITFAAFIMHIQSGGIYERKTIFAMTFRTMITLAIAITAYFIISKNKDSNTAIAGNTIHPT